MEKLKDMMCILDVTKYYSSGEKPIIVSNGIIDIDGFDSQSIDITLYGHMCITSLVSNSSLDRLLRGMHY